MKALKYEILRFGDFSVKKKKSLLVEHDIKSKH